MSTKDKIKFMRDMYIKSYGQEPKSLIVGHRIANDISNAREYIGMKVYIDFDKDNRVDVGNIREQI